MNFDDHKKNIRIRFRHASQISFRTSGALGHVASPFAESLFAEKILISSNKDDLKNIQIRAESAAREVLDALSPEGTIIYSLILYSAPEGPDGEDDWTSEIWPVGQAKAALEEFIPFYKGL